MSVFDRGQKDGWNQHKEDVVETLKFVVENSDAQSAVPVTWDTLSKRLRRLGFRVRVERYVLVRPVLERTPAGEYKGPPLTWEQLEHIAKTWTHPALGTAERFDNPNAKVFSEFRQIELAAGKRPERLLPSGNTVEPAPTKKERRK
jgi:hypothetical protein